LFFGTISLGQGLGDEVVKKPGGLEGSPRRAVDADAELLEQRWSHLVRVIYPGPEIGLGAAVPLPGFNLLR
jgi:hypothetical protein